MSWGFVKDIAKCPSAPQRFMLRRQAPIDTPALTPKRSRGTPLNSNNALRNQPLLSARETFASPSFLARTTAAAMASADPRKDGFTADDFIAYGSDSALTESASASAVPAEPLSGSQTVTRAGRPRLTEQKTAGMPQWYIKKVQDNIASRKQMADLQVLLQGSDSEYVSNACTHSADSRVAVGSGSSLSSTAWLFSRTACIS